MIIDKGIPIPVLVVPSNYAATVKQMEPGDSLLVKSPKEAKSVAQCLRNQGFNQATRKVPEGWRVWKVAKGKKEMLDV